MANFLRGTTMFDQQDNFSLIVHPDKLDFKPNDIRVMTDAEDLPTKENIVSHPCKILLLPSFLFS
jgi:hypothetical protein